jgi:hypothetical protein
MYKRPLGIGKFSAVFALHVAMSNEHTVALIAPHVATINAPSL